MDEPTLDFSELTDSELRAWVQTHCVECGQGMKTAFSSECRQSPPLGIVFRKWCHGFAALRVSDSLSPVQLLWVYVSPSSRGQRLGRRIVRAIAVEYRNRVIVAECLRRHRTMLGAAGFKVEKRLGDRRLMIRLPNGVGSDDNAKLVS